MKTKIYIYSILTGLALLASSCTDDFLKEEVKTGSNESAYESAAGITNLVYSCYAYTRAWYGKEPGIGLTEGGTDLFLKARDNRQTGLVEYSDLTAAPSSSAEKQNSCLDEYWEIFYAAVNNCNTAIDFVDKNKAISITQKNELKGEALFLRAFYYWHIVETWGAAPIYKTPTSTTTTNVVRDSEEDIYEFMLDDVNNAIILLANKTSKTGHVNLWTAKAFKARLLLYLASEYNGGKYNGGQQQAYLDAASTANEVIVGSGASFYTDYADCWNEANQDIITNKETIWGIEYNTNLTVNGIPMRLEKEEVDGLLQQKIWTQMITRTKSADLGGNTAHLQFSGMWNNHSKLSKDSIGADKKVALKLKVLDRTDKESKKTIQGVYVGSSFQTYSKGFCRFAPSGYLLDLYDETKDQRYAASFRDTYKIPAALTQYKNQYWFTQPEAKSSDTIIYLSKHATLTPEETAMMAGKRYIMGTRTSGDVKTFQFPMYANADGSALTTTTSNNDDFIFYGNNLFISCKKFDDWGTTSDASLPLIRDVSCRDVFVFRLSEMYLIKAEAEYSSGTGSALTTINELRDARAISGQTNSLASIDIQTILDERAMEFCGEQIRWFDLKRLGKLNSTYLADKNLVASQNIQSHHVLRPIPQVQMDAITNKGVFTQNTGY